jgi:hypothetical protein
VRHPTIPRASVLLTVNGATPRAQTVTLLGGTRALTGKAFWSGDAMKGFRYKNSNGENGLGSVAELKKSGCGTAPPRAVVVGTVGATTLMPPNFGTDATTTFMTTCGNAGSGNTQFLFAGAPTAGVPDATLCREGDYWTLIYAGVTGRLKDMKGFHYLVYLLEHPGDEFHVLALLEQVRSPAPGEPGLRGALRATDLPLLDARAKVSYRRRLVELREDLAEAERFHDAGRVERARTEMDALIEQLAAAVGLGGRDRPTGSAAERARTTVTHRLRAVIERIARQHPGLGDHLATRVRTGTFCAYTPDPKRPIDWMLGR